MYCNICTSKYFYSNRVWRLLLTFHLFLNLKTLVSCMYEMKYIYINDTFFINLIRNLSHFSMYITLFLQLKTVSCCMYVTYKKKRSKFKTWIYALIKHFIDIPFIFFSQIIFNNNNNNKQRTLHILNSNLSNNFSDEKQIYHGTTTSGTFHFRPGHGRPVQSQPPTWRPVHSSTIIPSSLMRRATYGRFDINYDSFVWNVYTHA